jgi:hypothetical protein
MYLKNFNKENIFKGPSSMTTSTANLRQQNNINRTHSQSQLILELIGSEEEGPKYLIFFH